MPASLLIGGVEYREWLRRGSLTHRNTQGSEPDGLSFRLVPGAVQPPVSAEVLYYEDDTMPPVFGGVVVDSSGEKAGTIAYGFRVSCVDWRVRASAKLLNKRWAGLTPGEIIVDAFATYAPEFDTSQVNTGGAPVSSLTFRRDGTLLDLLNKLQDATGNYWDIDPEKRVIFQAPASTNAPMVLQDGSLNYENLAVTLNRDSLATAVYVKGRPQPASTPTTDTYTATANTTLYRLTGTPYGLENYRLLEGSFNATSFDTRIWAETDGTNPSPAPGHIPSDGYLHTTIQSGVTLAPSGWCQIVGGSGVWGASRLMSQNTYPRGDGGHRYEWDVYVTAASTSAMFGLWDTTNQGAQAGCVHGVLFDGTSNQIRPWNNGAVQTALSTVTFAAGEYIRVRVLPKNGLGAVIQVNKDAANGFRLNQWVTLLDSTTGAASAFTVAGVFNLNFNGRVTRVNAYSRLYGVSLTVATVPKIVGLLGVDTDDASVDALIGIEADVPVLAFFGNVIPTAGQAIAITYYRAVPTSIRKVDPAAVAALKAIENPLNLPAGSDGMVEALLQDEKIDSTRLADQVATQFLADRANPEISLTFSTLTSGLRAGQALDVNLTAASGWVLSDRFLIVDVETESLGGGQYKRSVRATSRLRGFESLLIKLLDKPNVAPIFDDIGGPLEEFISGFGTVTGTESAVVAGPNVSGTDTVAAASAGTGTAGPDPAGLYLYGTATWGGSLLS